MRAEILHLLRLYPDQYVSGELISRQLSVSRTAVWKHIKALKMEGYDIESHPRLGYCLKQAPDLLLPEEISSRLKTECIGKNISYHSTISSTNNQAKILGNNGCIEGTIVLAESQEGGKGRLSRGWYSPFGKGIWLSVVLRPPILPQDAPKFTLMAAVAVYRAIQRVAPISCGIKWPNDLMTVNGTKLVGILTEMSAELDAINYVVIGMGINVNSLPNEFPDDLKDIATSIAAQAGYFVSRLDLLIAVLEELDTCYKHVLTQGFSTIFAEWRQYSLTLGQQVNVLGVDETFTGLAVDIDDEGALLVKTDTGLQRVLAGDVSIRPRK